MSRRIFTMWAAGLMIAAFFAGAAAAAVQKATQRGRAFFPKEASVAVGDQLTIENEDEFTHQVYIQADGFTFDSGEQDPGKAVTINFTKAGNFDALCRIHPKMRLKIAVK